MFRRLYEQFREEPIKLETPEGLLHGVVYSPTQGSPSGIVLVPPDGEEGMYAYRPLVTSARALAARGFTILRFDYRGQGQSDGEYESTTLTTRTADVASAIRFLQQRVGAPPIVLGARLGGAIAILAALAMAEIKHLVLWDPILDSAAYLQQLLRVNLSTQMVVHGKVVKDRQELLSLARAGTPVSVNGFKLSGAFMDQLLELNVRAAAAGWSGQGLILTSGAAAAGLTPSTVWTIRREPGMPFWKEPKTHIVTPPMFLGATLEWVEATVSHPIEEPR